MNRTRCFLEAVDSKTEVVVEQGNIGDLIESIRKLQVISLVSVDCRKRAEKLFYKDKSFEKYIELSEI